MIAVVAVWRLYAIAGGMLPPTPGVDVAPLDSTGKVPSSYLPAGSSASIPQKLLNYTTLAVDTSASDIGAATNAAIARLGGRMGTVTINPKDGPYTFSTRINIPKGVTIDAGMSTLVWNSNSGVAVYSGDTSNSLHKGGLKNCVLTTVAGYATGHTNIGIYSGGDPAGVISSTTAGGALQAFDNVDISGFKYGYSFGNNTWVTLFSNAAIHDNYDGLYDGGGQTNSGEEMMITDSLIFNNMHDGLDLNNINNEWVMKGGSLDYNGNVGVGGSGANMTCVGVHMEQSARPLFHSRPPRSCPSQKVSMRLQPAAARTLHGSR